MAERMKKVLFVCTANICRSPMAEAMFNALSDDAGLPFRAESAGVAALEDQPMSPNARRALEEVGIYAEDGRARQVSETMLKGADLVLAMSPRHVAELRQLFGSFYHKVHALPEFANATSGEGEISDPHGHAMAAHRACVRQLFEYLDRLVYNLGQQV